MTDRVGQQIGNYRLERLLGWGGFADVYLGQHIHLNTQTAIKILHAQLPAGETDQFLQEARTIARLEHPHIVKVLDFGLADNAPYLVMTYAPNGTVRQLHPKGSVLPLALAVSYAKQIASALHYLHDQKLIHRDVKPENLLLDAKHDILLSDFGTALIMQTVNMQGVQGLAGTVTYMAPEQLQGHPRAASDQYALAIVVYEWLCGECPFKGSFTEMSTQHVLVPPPSLRQKNPAISGDIEQVVMTALSKDPQQRFGSVQAFAQALADAANLPPEAFTTQAARQPSSSLPSNVLAKQAVSLTPPARAPLLTPDPRAGETIRTSGDTRPSGPRISGSGGYPIAFPQETGPIMPEPAKTLQAPVGDPTVRMPTANLTTLPGRRLSRRALLVAGACAAIAITGGGAVIAIVEETLHSSATAHSTAPTLSPSQKLTVYVYRGHTAAVNAVSWSPDNLRLISGSTDKTVQVWDAATGQNAVTYQHEAFVKTAAWSPDGKYLASGGHDRVVEEQNATTGAIVYAYHRYNGWINGVAWSPDSSRLASAGNDKTARVWDSTTGAHALIYHGHTNDVNAIVWSPDGKRIASGDASNIIQVWDAQKGAHLATLQGHADQVRALAWTPDGKYILSASWDHTVRVWDARSGAIMQTYQHSLPVEALALSPDGTTVASGGDDARVSIWTLATAKTIFTYTGHSKSIHAVSWSPNGQLLASASMDKTVHVWKRP